MAVGDRLSELIRMGRTDMIHRRRDSTEMTPLFGVSVLGIGIGVGV